MNRDTVLLIAAGLVVLYAAGWRFPSFGRFLPEGNRGVPGGRGYADAPQTGPGPLRIDIPEPLGSPDYGDHPWWQDNGAWAG